MAKTKARSRYIRHSTSAIAGKRKAKYSKPKRKAAGTMSSKRHAKYTRKPITYHGRTGFPMVHEAESGRQYIMVRKKGGGTKRLYEGAPYRTGLQGEEGETRILRLR